MPLQQWNVREPLLVDAEPKGKNLWTMRNLIIAGAVLVAIVIIVAVLFTGHKHTSTPLPPGSYKIAGTDVYVTGSSGSVLFIMPDAYGMTVEVKQIADYYASKGGFVVVVVDYFNGDPRNASDPGWGNRHPANQSLALASAVIADVRRRGYSEFQLQGYCWGGRVSVSLTFANNSALPQSVVVAHPSSLVQADANQIMIPISFVQPENDPGFNDIASYFNTTLIDRHITSQFKIYPGTYHGFAVNNNNTVQKKIAMDDSLVWFRKFAGKQ